MLGETVRRLRLQKGWTQAELADHAGISRQAMNNIERGRTGAAPKTLLKLATTLGVTVEELMGVDTPKVPAPVRSLSADQRRVLLGAIARKHLPPMPGELKQLAEIRRDAIQGGDISLEEFNAWFRRATAEDVREELLPEESASLEEQLVGKK